MSLNKLVVVGLLTILAGMALVILGSASQGTASTGGFVLIGPFPIVFGTGSSGGQLATLALIAGLVMVGLLLVLAWRLSSLSRGSF